MGLIKNILKREKKQQNNSTVLHSFTRSFAGDFESVSRLNNLYYSICQRHASNIAKVKPQFYKNEKINEKKRDLNYILTIRPNPFQSATQMWEEIAFKYFYNEIAIAFLDFDYSNIYTPLKAIYPLDQKRNNLEIITDKNKNIYFRFNIQGVERYSDGADLLILVKEPNGDVILGKENKAIKDILEILQINYKTIHDGIKNSSNLNYILKPPTILSPEKEKELKENFEANYLTNNKSGLLILNNNFQLEQIIRNYKWVNAEDMKHFTNQIFLYLGGSEKILKGEYTDEEFQAYYETIIEPYFNKIGEELTNKLLTKNEIIRGERVRVVQDLTQTASINARIKVADILLRLPIIEPTIIYNMLGLEIDKELKGKTYNNLNFVKSEDATKYQLGDSEKDGE